MYLLRSSRQISKRDVRKIWCEQARLLLLLLLLPLLLTYLLTYLHTSNLLTYLLTYLLTAIEFSLGGSSPYTSTDKTNKNKYT